MHWGGQIIIVGGNHDSVSTLNESGSLLKIANVAVVGGAAENVAEEVFVINELATDKPAALI